MAESQPTKPAADGAPQKLVSCIRCGRRNSIKAIRTTSRDTLYSCGACGATFDDDPDEGGTHGNRPDARLAREERERDRKRQQASQGRRLA